MRPLCSSLMYLSVGPRCSRSVLTALVLALSLCTACGVARTFLQKSARTLAARHAVVAGRQRNALGSKAKQPMLAEEVYEEEEQGVQYQNAPILDMQPRPVSMEQEMSEFRDFDTNGNGFIEPQEMARFFYELKPTQKDSKAIFNALDLDGNGAVDWREYKTPLDTELFDFLERSHNQVTSREIEFVEQLYTKEFGNPYQAMRSEQDAQYNMQDEEYSKPDADEKYLAGYGWFKGESPVIDEMYKGEIQDNPEKGEEKADNPGQHYAYSYGL